MDRTSEVNVGEQDDVERVEVSEENLVFFFQAEDGIRDISV